MKWINYNNKYLQLFVILIIIVFGTIYVRDVWIGFEKDQNDKLMQVGGSVAAAIPQDLIKALDARSGDVDKPQYKALKKILGSLTRINKHSRFAYIFSARSGKLYFMADSEPTGSEYGSPAGQEYFEATPTDKRLFEDGSVPVIEHSSDRWGEWMSVLVPVRDVVSGKTIAVFGMDFEKKIWKMLLLQELARSLFLVILLFLAFLFLLIIKKKNMQLKKEISKQASIEAALRESQSLYLSFIEQLPNAVFRMNYEGAYILVNSQFCRLKGLNMKDFIGKNPLSVVSKEIEVYGEKWHDTIFANADENIHKRILKTGAPFTTEEFYPTPDGGIRQMFVVRMPVVDSNGMIIGSQGIMFDITDLKQTEQALIRAKEKAEESDRLKSAFLTNMSHEIRTPMSSILGFAGLLKEPNLSGEAQQLYIQNIEQSGARMLNTLNNIICISKIESGQMAVSIADTDINELIRRVEILFRPEIEQKGLELIIRNTLSPNGVVLKTDGEKVGVILSNLVDNALKFTREGFIEIAYLLKNDEIEFRIKDSGAGVRPELKTFIFEIFRQGSDAYDRDYEGAGLGLSISKAYVDMLGGRIWVDSEPGNGSAFLFTIPLNVGLFC